MLSCAFSIFNVDATCKIILEYNYYRFSILAVFLAAGILIYTARNLYYIKKYNRMQSETQEALLKQARLIELSHEWNSRFFISARNRADLLRKDFKGNESSIYSELSSNNKIADWEYISAIAHFFERLSYIQLSNQVNRSHAMAEFKEAIEYWHDFLFMAYSYDGGDEERLRTALSKLKIEYETKQDIVKT